jgi:mono/diheme cytochrome c family protein
MNIVWKMTAAAVIAWGVAPSPTFSGIADLAEGEKTYASSCASCHAKDGTGNTARGKTLKAPNLRSDAVLKKTNEQLVDSILKSKAHGSVQKLGRDRLILTMEYVRTLK